MLPPGFEPGCSARKAEMIGRTTLQEQNECDEFCDYGEFSIPREDKNSCGTFAT